MQLANDLSHLRPFVSSFLARQHGHIINGRSMASNSTGWLPVLDPSSGIEIARSVAGNQNDVDLAVEAASSALKDERWAKMKPHQRERLMHRLADLIEEHADDIAELEALESGRKLADVRLFDAEFPAHILRYMAGWPTKITGETISISAPYMPAEMDFLCYTTREPIGVVAAITPWNVPLGIATWKIAPAIAAGCTVVLKPAEQTPLTALLLGELAIEAGFPPGVINVVTGTGQEVGDSLVRHPGVDKVTFTGSTTTGRRIGEVAGRDLKKVSLELGGKSPLVIMPDADIEVATATAAMAIFANQGQNCCAGSRLYLHRNVFDQVIDGLVKIARGIRLGPSLSNKSDMCPLISAQQKQRVQSMVQSGIDEGAELVSGGGSPDHPGFYHEPTVFIGVNQQMRIVREEIFGPVLAVQSVDDIDEAISMANDCEFGLGASIFTRDINVAQRFSENVEAGSVWVNTYNILDVGVPFGGYKNSGLGNDLGKEAVLAHTRIKANYQAKG